MKKNTTLTQDVKIKDLPAGANILIVMNQNSQESETQNLEGQLKIIFNSLLKQGHDYRQLMTLCRHLSISAALELRGSVTGAAELLGLRRTYVSTISSAGLTSRKTWMPAMQDGERGGSE